MDNIAIILLLIIVVAGAAALAFLYFRAKMRRKREEQDKQDRLRHAEETVLMSDDISREDISILRETDSPYLNEAVELRRQQVARDERRRDMELEENLHRERDRERRSARRREDD